MDEKIDDLKKGDEDGP